MHLEISLLILASITIIILSALFAMIESSIMVTDDIKYQIMLNRNDISDKAKKRITKIIEKKDKHITAMTVSITFTSISGSSLLGAMAAKYLTQQHVLIYTIIFTYLILVFARTLPKIVANYSYEKTLIKWGWLARVCYILNYPFILMTVMWVKIFKLDRQRQMSLNELKMIIKYYRKNGIIEKTEQKMLEKIFNVKQLVVSDVMDKLETFIMDHDKKVSDYKHILKNTNNKRFLVRKDEDIIGIVFYRDITSALFSEENNEALVSDYCRQTITINHDDNLMDSIVRFKDGSATLAVVLDEEKKAIGTVTIKQVYNHILSN